MTHLQIVIIVMKNIGRIMGYRIIMVGKVSILDTNDWGRHLWEADHYTDLDGEEKASL